MNTILDKLRKKDVTEIVKKPEIKRTVSSKLFRKYLYFNVHRIPYTSTDFLTERKQKNILKHR
jgi:intergrase/recombinase